MHVHAHIRHACLIDVAEAPATGVKELKTDQEYRSVLQEAAKTNALSVFDYTASWCGPCESLFGPGSACRIPVVGSTVLQLMTHSPV